MATHHSKGIGSIRTAPMISALPRGLTRAELEQLLTRTRQDIARLKESREVFEAAQRAASHEPPKGPSANEICLAIRETQVKQALAQLDASASHTTDADAAHAVAEVVGGA